MTTNNPLASLSEAGVSIWLDDLSRDRINSGNLAELIRDYHVTGVTTNPTIFAGALAGGRAYDDQVRELAARGASVDAAVKELTTTDVRNACDLFRDIYHATDGIDGRVSIEVDPGLAHDSEATAAEALDLWKTVDRPNLLVKIPATKAGLPAITRTLAEGVSVNVTLIFSTERYREVMDAFVSGLEQAKQRGHDVTQIHSVASFFVSRVDTEVDKRIDALDGAAAESARSARGAAAIANARLAYAAYQEVFTSDRWQELATAGARPQRPLWASTGMKDPNYRDTLYVEDLVVAGTVNTMPEKTLYATAEHGSINGDKVTGTADAAEKVFATLRQAGIDVADVFRVLEDEGVQKFEKSWAELQTTVREQLAESQR
ncbi:transaldolase [Tamaricihabitans halophyticus]|uniref:Transaldolase n=1 Tax=Tamaricihabitans halophyticus TaxID=1262583 RepID=A0A4R2QGU1_9PSEU|nr:transaldolase [Tamaricihabitans halophyticus]TCP46225.1 transaldolase [Tamaricihabitans halophyticus]